MTEEGAKAALKAKIDADANWALKTEAEKALLQANGTIVVLTIENNKLKEVARVKSEEIRQLGWALFKANLFKWGSVALNIFLAGKLAKFY